MLIIYADTNNADMSGKGENLLNLDDESFEKILQEEVSRHNYVPMDVFKEDISCCTILKTNYNNSFLNDPVFYVEPIYDNYRLYFLAHNKLQVCDLKGNIKLESDVLVDKKEIWTGKIITDEKYIYLAISGEDFSQLICFDKNNLSIVSGVSLKSNKVSNSITIYKGYILYLSRSNDLIVINKQDFIDNKYKIINKIENNMIPPVVYFNFSKILIHKNNVIYGDMAGKVNFINFEDLINKKNNIKQVSVPYSRVSHINKLLIEKDKLICTTDISTVEIDIETKKITKLFEKNASENYPVIINNQLITANFDTVTFTSLETGEILCNAFLKNKICNLFKISTTKGEKLLALDIKNNIYLFNQEDHTYITQNSAIWNYSSYLPSLIFNEKDESVLLFIRKDKEISVIDIKVIYK